MPNNWQMVDTNFPTVTGEEPVKEQISKIIDYLQILTEQLQYQLQNLDSSNWNASALTEMEDNAAARYDNMLKTMQSRLDTLAGRINSAEGLAGRMTAAEENIGFLEQDAEEMAGLVEELQEQLGAAQADIDELQALLPLLQLEEDRLTIGGEGKTVHINGTVYINGVLQGEPAEEEA